MLFDDSIIAKVPFNLIESWSHTGSRIICDPSPLNTDSDYIILTNDIDEFTEWVTTELGFKQNGKGYEDKSDDFRSFKLKYNSILVNFIVTTSEVFYTRWCAATALASLDNLLVKQDRINLFDIVLYGKT